MCVRSNFAAAAVRFLYLSFLFPIPQNNFHSISFDRVLIVFSLSRFVYLCVCVCQSVCTCVCSVVLSVSVCMCVFFSACLFSPFRTSRFSIFYCFQHKKFLLHKTFDTCVYSFHSIAKHIIIKRRPFEAEKCISILPNK